MNNYSILWFAFIFIASLCDIYFTLSLVFFIISTVKKKKGATTGLAAHQTAWKVHFIISTVLLVLTVVSVIVLTVMMLHQPMTITFM